MRAKRFALLTCLLAVGCANVTEAEGATQAAPTSEGHAKHLVNAAPPPPSVSSGTGPQRVETRCGWFENPTPGNAWLVDRDGEWDVGLQGGWQAEGDWPKFGGKDWVKTNGTYGYGCACMSVIADKQNEKIIKIMKVSALPLAKCRSDKSLVEPTR